MFEHRRKAKAQVKWNNFECYSMKIIHWNLKIKKCDCMNVTPQSVDSIIQSYHVSLSLVVSYQWDNILSK